MRHIFIINPNLSNMYAAETIREQLKKLENFDYLVFNTEYPGHEKALVEQMEDLFCDEVIRFYCCGGMGTFSNMLDGISNLKKTEIALFPCGVSCDLLKSFGKDRRYFGELSNLIIGEAIPVDLIELGDYRASNTIMVGAGVNSSRRLDQIRGFYKFFEPLAYCGDGIFSIFFDRVKEYEILIDGRQMNGDYKQIYIGNGCCMGAKYYPIPYATPFDGNLNFMLIKNMSILHFMKMLRFYRLGELEEYKENIDIFTGKEFKIRPKDGTEIGINLDGEFKKIKELNGKVIPSGMNFVVPRQIVEKIKE